MKCIKNCEKKPLLIGEYTKFTLAGISIFRTSKENQNLIEKQLVKKNGVKITVFSGKVNDVCFELSEGSKNRGSVRNRDSRPLISSQSYLAILLLFIVSL